jgi:hypothetical protein
VKTTLRELTFAQKELHIHRRSEKAHGTVIVDAINPVAFIAQAPIYSKYTFRAGCENLAKLDVGGLSASGMREGLVCGVWCLFVFASG